MSANNFDRCLALVLRWEGGFVNHPKDPGGMTNLGVTKKTLEAYEGHPVDEATMRALTPAQVAPIYRTQYWDKVRANELPDGVDYTVFDCAVNSGPSRAIKLLQHVVGTTEDGVLGPQTMAKVQRTDPKTLTERYARARLDFLRSLPTFDTFGKGWTARVVFVADNS